MKRFSEVKGNCCKFSFQFKLPSNIELFTIFFMISLLISSPFLVRFFSYNIVSVIQVTFLCMILIWCTLNRIKMSPIFIFIFLLCAFFMFSTFLNSGHIVSGLRKIIPIITISLILDACQGKEDRNEVIYIIHLFIYMFLLIDLLTMVVFPNGLYKNDLYTQNWFLGYKTERALFLLPFISFKAYLSVIKKNKLDCSFWFSAFLVLIDIYISGASSCLVGLIFFYFAIFLFDFLNKNKCKTQLKWLQICISYKAILLYVILSLLLITMSNNKIFVHIATNVFHKSPTFSGRTTIWSNLLSVFFESPMFGYGMLTADQFINYSLLDAGTNAHNFILSFLLNGGIISLILYFFLHMYALEYAKWSAGNYVIVCSIYAIWIIGFMSATFTFSPLMYVLYFLLESKTKERKVWL